MVHENYYGTSLKPVLNALNDGKMVVFDIDVQGFKIVKSKFTKGLTSVFITTKDKKELKQRLELRFKNTLSDINHRIINATNEIMCINEYDYLIINDDLSEAYKALESIFIAMKFKTSNLDFKSIINNWVY